MIYQEFEQAADTFRKGLPLSKAQRASLHSLLRHLCGTRPPDLLPMLASRFYGEMDWEQVRLCQANRLEADTRQINLAFPIDNQTEGLMQVYEWWADGACSPRWSVRLGTSAGPAQVKCHLLGTFADEAAKAFCSTTLTTAPERRLA